MSDIDNNELRAETKEQGRAAFFRRIDNNILEMIAHLSGLESMKISQFDKKRTALVVIDVVNGFVREGAMKSERIEEIVSPVLNTVEAFRNNSMKIIAFADCHSENSSELTHFPKHCLADTSESEIIDEIKNAGGYILINKNSVNGFFAPDFEKFMNENPDINTYVVCGDCTDICVMNFCLTLKAYYDQQNKPSEIIVPIDSVETYDDCATHNGDLMNIVALEMMNTAGIKIINSVEDN